MKWVSISDEVFNTIKAKAAEQTNFESDPSGRPCDWSGGNFDDAHSAGTDDGEIYFARYILKLIEKTEKT